MTDGRTLGLLGGTFDPIHYGHLDAADAAADALALDEVHFIPAHDPPHRPVDPRAAPFHRFALASLAVNDRPRCRVSDIELARERPSFTIDTLRALHAEGWEPWQLFFIIGTDAFAEIASWRAFPSVLDAAHFVVIARPGMTVDMAVARTPELRPRACLASESGRLKPASTDTRLGRLEPAQGTDTRGGRLEPAQGTDTHGGWLQPAHETRILLVEAHTRDVSSTLIRQRLAAGQPIDDLVPAPVARHILAHHLYGAVDTLHGKDERARN